MSDTLQSCQNVVDFFDYPTEDSYNWPTTVLKSPTEIRETLESFQLVGRKIRHIRIMGLNYLHTRDRMEDFVYDQMDSRPEEERQRRSEYPNFAPHLQFYRQALIDEPLMIEFTDADVFEIGTSMTAQFLMSMNLIPKSSNAKVNTANEDAEILFSPCIGRTLVSIEVNTETVNPDVVPECELPAGSEYVSGITLRLDDGSGLNVSAEIDYCYVSYTNSSDEIFSLSFAELEPALYNWEDLHCDPVTGYQSHTSFLYFGQKGFEHIAKPYRTLCSSGKKSARAYLPYTSCLLLDWCFSFSLGRLYDRNSDYRFRYDEWKALLENTTRLLSYSRFRDLDKDPLVLKYEGTLSAFLLNGLSARLWDKRDYLLSAVDDLRKWSKHVLKPNDVMYLYSY